MGGFKSRSCNDKPEMKLDCPDIDNGAVDRMIKACAGMQSRNYVVMEVKGNLVAEQREAVLKKFPSHAFRRVAHVQLGEPDEDFKKKTQQVTLERKQAASDIEFKKKLAEEKRKRQAEKKRKENERAKAKAEKERAKKMKELKKKQEAEKKAAEKKKLEAEGKEVPEEKEEEPEPEEPDEPEEPVEEETAVMDEDPPKVELTAEEKAMCFVKVTTPDLTPTTLNTSFGSYSVPDKAEGFDDIKFNWSAAAKSKEFLKTYILDKKATTRVEDITPSAWFREKNASWEKSEQKWRKAVSDYKASIAKRDAEKKKKEQAKIAKAKAAEAAKKKAEEAEKNGEKKEEKKEEDTKPMEVEDSEDTTA